jgi:hypothetical protein
MDEMLKWMLIVEVATMPATANFLRSITADTEENREYLEKVRQIEKQIEWEEQREINLPITIQSVPHIDDKKEWDAYWQAQELEWDKLKRKHDEQTRQQMRKSADAYKAQVDGIRLAAKDAMDDLIERDRDLVSKLAQQAIKAQQQKKQRIRKQAMQQVKSS